MVGSTEHCVHAKCSVQAQRHSGTLTRTFALSRSRGALRSFGRTVPRGVRRDDNVPLTRYFGRLAQWESTALTTQGSAVRTRHRPRRERAGQQLFSTTLHMRTYVQAAAKSNKNPTCEVSSRASRR